MVEFDHVLSELRPGGAVSITFGAGPDPNRWDEVGRLEVAFEWADHNGRQVPTGVASVRLSLREGLTPTKLQRFPWARWLNVAEAVARNRDSLFAPPATNIMESLRIQGEQWAHNSMVIGTQIDQALGRKPATKKRPGRKGHTDEFYRNVAQAYTELVASGERAPNQRLAKESGYSRDTVAGWVRKARLKEFLPPARRGKPG